MKNSLGSITKETKITEIKVDVNIFVKGSNDGTGNMLPYVNRAKGKIEQQLRESIHNMTGVGIEKINVNVTPQNGDNSNSTTTVSIREKLGG